MQLSPNLGFRPGYEIYWKLTDEFGILQNDFGTLCDWLMKLPKYTNLHRDTSFVM